MDRQLFGFACFLGGCRVGIFNGRGLIKSKAKGGCTYRKWWSKEIAGVMLRFPFVVGVAGLWCCSYPAST